MESKKPKKQRKAFHSKPLHRRQKEVAAHLEKKLARDTGLRSIPLRKGDSVKVMKGDFKGKSGKIERADLSSLRVFIEKVSRKKADGTEVLVGFQPSNLLVTSIDKSDEKRLKRLKRAKQGSGGAPEGKAEKAEKPAERKPGEEKSEKPEEKKEPKAEKPKAEEKGEK